MAGLPDRAVLTWASEVVRGEVLEVVTLHVATDRDSSSFKLRMEAGGDFTDCVLTVPVPDWIGPRMVAKERSSATAGGGIGSGGAASGRR